MKEKLLLKSGQDQKLITESDTFSINPNYSSKQKKVKVNSIQKKETVIIKKYLININFFFFLITYSSERGCRRNNCKSSK